MPHSVDGRGAADGGRSRHQRNEQRSMMTIRPSRSSLAIKAAVVYFVGSSLLQIASFSRLFSRDARIMMGSGSWCLDYQSSSSSSGRRRSSTAVTTSMDDGGIGGGYWDYHYMDAVPPVDEPWPIEAAVVVSSASSAHGDDDAGHDGDDGDAGGGRRRQRLTTCIPGLYRDARRNLPKLLSSVSRQTIPADEVVVVMSDVVPKKKKRRRLDDGSDDQEEEEEEGQERDDRRRRGESRCRESYEVFQRELSGTGIPLRLLCIGERIMAGQARNVAGRLSSGSILSYVDSDDTENPPRNEVVHNLFLCHPHLKMIVHSMEQRQPHPYKPTENPPRCLDDEKGLRVIGGVDLHDLVCQTQRRKQLWVHGHMAPGHVVLHRSVLDHVQFTSLHFGEDSLLVRDVVYMYGRENGKTIYIGRPLTSYMKRGMAFKDLEEYD